MNLLHALLWTTVGALLATIAWTVWHRRQLRHLDDNYRTISREWQAIAREHTNLDHAWTEHGEAVARHQAVLAEWHLPPGL